MNSTTKNILKKFIVAFFVLVLVVTGVSFVNSGDNYVQAEESTTETGSVTFFSEKVTNLQDYRGKSYTYPKPTEADKQDWIFAGWYVDADCTIAYTTEQGRNDETRKTITSDVTEAYAKYVRADVLTVKTQVLKGTNQASESTNMRFVSTVDSTDYRTVGFRIISNGKEKSYPTKDVFKRIKSNTDGLDVGYSPVAFDSTSNYFQTFTLTNIKNVNFDRQHFVQAYWQTLDGTVVYGTGRNVKVSDSYNKIANVPVRLYTDETVTGGTVRVKYNSSLFTYIDYEPGKILNGQDAVSITDYAAINVANASDNTYINITLPEGTSIASPNGTLVNLRFQVVDSVPSNYTFEVETETEGVFDIIHKTYSQYYDAELGADTSWYDAYKDEEEQKFVITTANDLYGLAEIVNAVTTDQPNGVLPDVQIFLGSDIVINEGQVNTTSANGWSTSNPVQWLPIGYKANTKRSFAGTFDGLGHTISGIYSKTEDTNNGHYYGLFGITHFDSELQNFRIENSYFNRTSTNATPQSLVASVAGQPMGDIRSVYSKATIVSGSPYAGGIAARVQTTSVNYTQQIDNCWFDGTITVTYNANKALRVGGIVAAGFNAGHTNISNCLNTGTITCNYTVDATVNAGIGGIIGEIVNKNTYYVDISNCMSTGTVTVKETVTTTNDDETTSTTTPAYATGVASIVGCNQNKGHTETVDGVSTTVANVSISNTIGTTTSHTNGYKQGSGALYTYENWSLGKQDNDYFSGYTAYNNAKILGIYADDTNETGKWVLRTDGTPTLKTFEDEWIDAGWYFERKETEDYLIDTAEELHALSIIAQDDSFSGDTVKLGADIKLNSGVASVWVENANTTSSLRDFTPIGNKDKAFAGTLDGQGKEISGLYVDSEIAYTGLFGHVTGTVKDFSLTNSFINSTKAQTGSIVGYAVGATLEDIYSDAYVQSSQRDSGGLVGRVSGTGETTSITNCWFGGKVNNTGNVQYVGGLVAMLEKGTLRMTDCLFTGDVDSARNTGNGYIGGLIGGAYASAGVTGVQCHLTDCVSNGTVTTKKTTGAVGSVVGSTNSPNTNEGAIHTYVDNVYSATTVTSEATLGTSYALGGFGSASYQFNAIDGSALELTDAELKGNNAYAYTNLTFRHSNEDTDQTGAWVTTANGPELYDFSTTKTTSTFEGVEKVNTDWYCDTVKFNEGSQTVTGFTINNASDFRGLAVIVNNLTEDFSGCTVSINESTEVIDLNEGWKAEVDENGELATEAPNAWTPIARSNQGGADRFQGTFNGNGCTIKGVYIESKDNFVGLFGYCGETGIIRNFSLENSYFDLYKQSGAVVGGSQGTVQDVYVKDDVTIVSKEDNIGGIVGQLLTNNKQGISNSWFDGTMIAGDGEKSYHIGGIVGNVGAGNATNKKHITNCLFTGTIISNKAEDAHVGGIIGSAYSASKDKTAAVTLSKCLSAGTVQVATTEATVGAVAGSALNHGTGATTVVIEDVYYVDVPVDSTDASIEVTGAALGCGSNSANAANCALTGAAQQLAIAKLTGTEASKYTELDLASKEYNVEGVWALKSDGVPQLNLFADSDVNTHEDVQTLAKGWYYNNFTYNSDAAQATTTYKVVDDDDMFGLADMVNNDNMTFADLTVMMDRDIEFNNVAKDGNEAAGWAETLAEGGSLPMTSWTPIGESENKSTITFSGVFDGDGHTISGLYMNLTERKSVGLFGNVKGATIQNLRLENSFLNGGFEAGTYVCMGSIVGYDNGVTMNNVYSDAIINSSSIQTGGLVGRIQVASTLKNCWFAGDIIVDYKGTSTVGVGGVVGVAMNGGKTVATTLDTCLYTGNIQFDAAYTHATNKNLNACVGGLLGQDNTTNTKVVIQNCFSAGTIDGTLSSESSSQVATMNGIGSVIGYSNSATMSAGVTYSTTDMSKSVAGKSSAVTSIYGANGANFVKANFSATNVDEDSVLGFGSRLLTNLTFTSNEATSEKMNGHWCARLGEIPIPSTMQDVVENELAIGDLGRANTDWYKEENKVDGAYVIDSIEELYGFAVLSRSNTFEGETIKLGADIKVNDSTRINDSVKQTLGIESDWKAAEWAKKGISAALPWYQIAVASNANTKDTEDSSNIVSVTSKRFMGTFDGDKYSISGIYMNEGLKYMGLFASTEYGSLISNLRLENSYFKQQGEDYLGSIVADCRGSIYNVYSDAVLETDTTQVGGIVARANGYNCFTLQRTNDMSLKNCWFAGTIDSSDTNIGGIVAAVVQGEWEITNCVYTGFINSSCTEDAYAGGIIGNVMAPSRVTSKLNGETVYTTGETKIEMNSCISTGTIKSANIDKSVGAVVGYMAADVVDDTYEEKNTHLKMTNVFASHDAGYTDVCTLASANKEAEDGVAYSAAAIVEGDAVWTNSADRLVGYCTEEEKDGYYAGGKLDFTSSDVTSTFVIREEGVPVPATFTDMDHIVTVVPTSDLDTILALKTMDTTWSLENAVNNGLGHYVLRTTGKDTTTYQAYLTALEGQQFVPYMAETVKDGVHSVTYTRENGEWIVKVLYTENTNSGDVTVTISNGFASLSDDLQQEANVTEGDVTMSMLQLTGKGEASSYYYGNSFVFKLPTVDESGAHFVINDGGSIGDFAGLVSQLKKMAGINENDATDKKIYIDAWTVTHQHGDHFNVIRSFMSDAAARDLVRVKAFYINEPNRKAMLAHPADGDTFDTVKYQYRAMRMMKDADGNTPKIYWCQTGETYYFDGLTMDIIQSQEQIPVDTYAKRNAYGADGTDYNTTSASMLFTTANQKKILITGDMNYVNMKRIMAIYGNTPSILSGINVYQAPHHGKNTSMNIGSLLTSANNTFTNYLAGLTNNGTFDVSLFPCSKIYGVEYSDSTVFPQAKDANNHLISKSSSYYHYGDGTKTFILGNTIELQQ